jgi:hypothetical protein
MHTWSHADGFVGTGVPLPIASGGDEREKEILQAGTFAEGQVIELNPHLIVVHRPHD